MPLGWPPGGEVDSGYAQQGDNGQDQADQAQSAAAGSTLGTSRTSRAGSPSRTVRSGFTAAGTNRARRAGRTDRTAITRVSCGSRVSLGTGRTCGAHSPGTAGR